MLITGQYPAVAGFLNVRLSDRDRHWVALMPFWSPPYLVKNQIAKHSSFAPGVTQDKPAEMYSEFMSSMSIWGSNMYFKLPTTSLRFNTVKIHGLDTILQASRKQHEVLCQRLKAKKVVLHTILLVIGGSIYTSHTSNHL